jgi:hypothetical protein
MTASAAIAGFGALSDDRFARVCDRLGLDDPGLFTPRRPAVLAALEATTRLDSSQLRTMVRVQQPRMTPRGHDRAITLGGELRAALGCVREEARQHGRLVALGQAWASSNQLAALITGRSPALTPIVASAVAGEVLCRLLDDVHERRVLSRDDEDLLRRAWRQAHPVPAYFRRRP